MGDVPQVQAGADIEKLPAQTSTPAVRRSGNPDDGLHIRNMDTHKRARKNVSIDVTQNASTHHTNDKKIQKIVKRKDETNEEKDTDDLGSIGDESGDGQSSITHNDQDSDVSFENDTDEEIYTTVIEEEDWIEYTKKEHRRSHGKDGKCEDSMLEQDSQKNEMETGAEGGNITE